MTINALREIADHQAECFFDDYAPEGTFYLALTFDDRTGETTIRQCADKDTATAWLSGVRFGDHYAPYHADETPIVLALLTCDNCNCIGLEIF